MYVYIYIYPYIYMNISVETQQSSYNILFINKLFQISFQNNVTYRYIQSNKHDVKKAYFIPLHLLEASCFYVDIFTSLRVFYSMIMFYLQGNKVYLHVYLPVYIHDVLKKRGIRVYRLVCNWIFKIEAIF